MSIHSKSIIINQYNLAVNYSITALFIHFEEKFSFNFIYSFLFSFKQFVVLSAATKI